MQLPPIGKKAGEPSSVDGDGGGSIRSSLPNISLCIPKISMSSAAQFDFTKHSFNTIYDELVPRVYQYYDGGFSPDHASLVVSNVTLRPNQEFRLATLNVMDTRKNYVEFLPESVIETKLSEMARVFDEQRFEVDVNGLSSFFSDSSPLKLDATDLILGALCKYIQSKDIANRSICEWYSSHGKNGIEGDLAFGVQYTGFNPIMNPHVAEQHYDHFSSPLTDTAFLYEWAKHMAEHLPTKKKGKSLTCSMALFDLMCYKAFVAQAKSTPNNELLRQLQDEKYVPFYDGTDSCRFMQYLLVLQESAKHLIAGFQESDSLHTCENVTINGRTWNIFDDRINDYGFGLSIVVPGTFILVETDGRYRISAEDVKEKCPEIDNNIHQYDSRKKIDNFIGLKNLVTVFSLEDRTKLRIINVHAKAPKNSTRRPGEAKQDNLAGLVGFFYAIACGRFDCHGQISTVIFTDTNYELENHIREGCEMSHESPLSTDAVHTLESKFAEINIGAETMMKVYGDTIMTTAKTRSVFQVQPNKRGKKACAPKDKIIRISFNSFDMHDEGDADIRLMMGDPS